MLAIYVYTLKHSHKVKQISQVTLTLSLLVCFSLQYRHGNHWVPDLGRFVKWSLCSLISLLEPGQYNSWLQLFSGISLMSSTVHYTSAEDKSHFLILRQAVLLLKQSPFFGETGKGLWKQLNRLLTFLVVTFSSCVEGTVFAKWILIHNWLFLSTELKFISLRSCFIQCSVSGTPDSSRWPPVFGQILCFVLSVMSIVCASPPREMCRHLLYRWEIWGTGLFSASPRFILSMLCLCLLLHSFVVSHYYTAVENSVHFSTVDIFLLQRHSNASRQLWSGAWQLAGAGICKNEGSWNTGMRECGRQPGML